MSALGSEYAWEPPRLMRVPAVDGIFAPRNPWRVTDGSFVYVRKLKSYIFVHGKEFEMAPVKKSRARSRFLRGLLWGAQGWGPLHITDSITFRRNMV